MGKGLELGLCLECSRLLPLELGKVSREKDEGEGSKRFLNIRLPRSSAGLAKAECCALLPVSGSVGLGGSLESSFLTNPQMVLMVCFRAL